MARTRFQPRRVRNVLILLTLAALAGYSFYRGGVLDISASPLRVGYGTSDRTHFSDQPFAIGHPDQYRRQGVYLDFARSHGIYLVTERDHLFALSVENLATGRITRFEPMTSQFSDPHTGDRFSAHGMIRGVTRDVRRILEDRDAVKAALDAGQGDRLPRSLERCYIRLRGKIDNPDATLLVDPRHRYLFELNQWSHPYSAYIFSAAAD